MPKLTKGCYGKIGYPDIISLANVTGKVYGVPHYMEKLTLELASSGGTREVRNVLEMPYCVAKIMPARISRNWNDGWDQNKTEHEVLHKLEKFKAAPRILFYAEQVPFYNASGDVDYLNLLLVSKLGDDMQAAAGKLDLTSFVAAYKAALWALHHMLKLGVVVPDPHPYNLALEAGGTARALPCDYGSTTLVTEKGTHSLLKKLFKGFEFELQRSYGVALIPCEALTQACRSCTATIDPKSMRTMQDYFNNAMQMTADPWAGADDAHWKHPQRTSSQAPPSPPQAGPAPLPGKFVVIKNLLTRDELNGVEAIVQVVLGPDRVQVKTSLNTVYSIAWTNLDVIPHPRSVWICRYCNLNAYWPKNPEAGWTGGKGKWRCPTCPPATGPKKTSRSLSTSAAPPPPKTPRTTAPPTTAPREVKLAALGLPASSSSIEIKQAYRRWLLLAHPDKGGDSCLFADFNVTWMSLMMP